MIMKKNMLDNTTDVKYSTQIQTFDISNTPVS